MQTEQPKVPYVGSRISLISKSGIRYVGTLYTIDTKDSTVALKDVRSFGTEGRPRDAGPVQPSDQIYSYIIFRGPDIMDLQFLTDPTPQPTSEQRRHLQPNQPPSASASVPSSVTHPQPQQPQPPPSQRHPASPPSPPSVQSTHTVSHPSILRMPHAPLGQPRGEHMRTAPTINGAPAINGAPTPPTPRAWGPPPGRRQRRRAGPPNMPVPDEDFDFESMNRQFEKAVTLDGKPVEKRYDKSKSFFDSLVSEKEMRGERNPAQQRATDLETFGEAAVRRGRRGRGRGRGRGRRRLPNQRMERVERVSNA